MPKLAAYLSFDGTAAEAMGFYAQALGARVDALMKFSDAPGAAPMPPGSGDRVMHAQLSFDNGDLLMASDWVGANRHEGMKGFSVALTCDTAGEAARIFDALAKDGITTVPLQQSFFAEAFGMLIDRFGTPWTISGGRRQG